jgi:hypothetical protein
VATRKKADRFGLEQQRGHCRDSGTPQPDSKLLEVEAIAVFVRIQQSLDFPTFLLEEMVTSPKENSLSFCSLK